MGAAEDSVLGLASVELSAAALAKTVEVVGGASVDEVPAVSAEEEAAISAAISSALIDVVEVAGWDCVVNDVVGLAEGAMDKLLGPTT